MIKKFIKKIIGPTNLYFLKDWLGMASSKHVDEKRQKFYAQFIDEGSLYFDVGANYGNRIKAMLQLGCKVLAVEPQQECCIYLKRKFGSKITIVNKGLGEEEGLKEFFISEANTISSFSKNWIDAVQKSGRFGQNRWNKKTIVEMTTLDNLIAQFGKPDFIKIDVEGYELEVLKGLSAPVRYISFEYTVPEQTQNAIACIEYIHQISSDFPIKCNYSVGESMEWGSSRWLTKSEMISLILSEEFNATGFGDTYIKVEQ